MNDGGVNTDNPMNAMIEIKLADTDDGDPISLKDCYAELGKLADIEDTKHCIIYASGSGPDAVGVRLTSLVRVLFDMLQRIDARVEEFVKKDEK